MARRLISVQNCTDFQVLKKNFDDAVICSTSSSAQVLTQIEKKPNTYAVVIRTEFGVNDLNLLKIFSYLQKNSKQRLNAKEAEYSLYIIGADPLFPGQETLLETGTLEDQGQGNFFKQIDKSLLSLPTDNYEYTLAVEVSIKRFKKIIKNKIYFNDNLIDQNFQKIRRRVIVLETLGKGPGQSGGNSL